MGTIHSPLQLSADSFSRISPDAYADPWAAVEARKKQYLEMITASRDEDGVAKRRTFLKRGRSGTNPRPEKLSNDNGGDGAWLTNPEGRARDVPDDYGYFAGEDVSLVLA